MSRLREAITAFQSAAAGGLVTLILLIGGGVGHAAADDCVALGGTLGAECVISGVVPAKSGTFTIAEALRFTSGGQLNVGTAGITINITPAGDFIMENNTLIDASSASNNGAPITVTLSNGNVDLQTGSIVRSNGKSGGFIQITTGTTGIVD